VQPERPEQCYKLLRWCLDSGLLLRLSEGYLLVLGMDPAPFLARGPPGLEDLTNTVLLAMNGGQKLQGFVMSMWVLHLQTCSSSSNTCACTSSHAPASVAYATVCQAAEHVTTVWNTCSSSSSSRLFRLPVGCACARNPGHNQQEACSRLTLHV
jgi:hypothetical protein